MAAGLGHMGIHRNLIHPRFGSFVLLATVVLGTPVSAYGVQPMPGVQVESVVAADGLADYRERVTDTETVSMWQSLAFGPNYKGSPRRDVAVADHRGARVFRLAYPRKRGRWRST